MKLDVKVFLAGLALWVIAFVSIPVALDHQSNLDLPPTSTDIVYHWVGISGLILLLIGSLAVLGASVAFSGRFAPLRACIAGLSFWVPVALLWLLTRTIVMHTYTWTFILLPWSVAIFSGALLLIVGLARLAVSNFRR